jgi:hypothetical protein
MPFHIDYQGNLLRCDPTLKDINKQHVVVMVGKGEKIKVLHRFVEEYNNMEELL